jgi:hypothetical protein
VLNKSAMRWLLSSDDGGLKRSLYAIKLHSDVSAHFVGLGSIICSVTE